MQQGYDSETVQEFLEEVERERKAPRLTDRRSSDPLTASDIALVWWSFFRPPLDLPRSPDFAADSIDLRETMMAIATAVGGPEKLPAPMDALWEPMGVEQWEIRRLRQLRSWHAAARMTESMSGGEVPNIWPHPTGLRWVATTYDLEDSPGNSLFPGGRGLVE